MASLLPLVLVIGYDVVGRKFFETGSVVLQDLQWHLHGAALLLGFGHAYLKDAHVRVDLLREHFSPAVKARLEIAGIVMFMVLYLGASIAFGVGPTQQVRLRPVAAACRTAGSSNRCCR